MSDNKLVKTVIEAAILTGLAAGIGCAAKMVVKETFTSDASSSAMNYVKFSVVMAGSIALRQYLEDQKIIPNNKKIILSCEISERGQRGSNGKRKGAA